jgi:hypothetical protein
MGGGGKGGGGSTQTSGSAALEAIAKQINEEITPVRQEFTKQLQEALTTGGVGARLPLVQSMTEQAGKATSDTLKQVTDQLSQSGMIKSPYGQRILADTALSGEYAKKSIPSSVVQQLLSVLPNYTLGTGNTIVSGLTGASDAQSRMYAANTQADAAKGASQMQFAGKLMPSMSMTLK